MIVDAILNEFGIQGAIDEIAPFGLGHINDSYRVRSGDQHLFLQKINIEIFTDIEAIENNLRLFFEHDSSIFVKHYKANGQYHLVHDEAVWRLTEFQAGCYSPQMPEVLEELAEVAKGFGRFAKAAGALNPGQFQEPILRFHDLSLRWQQLDDALRSASKGRLERAGKYIEQARQYYRELDDELGQFIKAGLTERVSHNDCKINNCLLSKADKSFSFVVDLDTIGPGYLLYDFGDLMRTCLVKGQENEASTANLYINPEAFDVLAKNYVQACGQVLTETENNSLVFGGPYMTFIMAIRFLADYLRGDLYYKTSFAEENLIRARNQFFIFEQLVEFRPKFESKFKSYV